MKIFTNIRNHLPDFVRLNELWVKEYFQIEERDRELARNPEAVIESGGYVFTGVLENRVIATSALFVKENSCELARMSVEPDYKGRGYGRKMAEEAIAVARQLGVERLILYTNSVQVPAVTLYESLGFKTIHRGPHPEYCRCDMVMELPLS